VGAASTQYVLDATAKGRIATTAMDEAYRLAVPLACYCQLRRGEVLGLQRKHIDMEGPILRVEQAWTLSGGEMHLGPPKTQAGRRDVPIPANVVPILIDHLERFAGEGTEGWLFQGMVARWSARGHSTVSGLMPGKSSDAQTFTFPISGTRA
jgi:integrase